MARKTDRKRDFFWLSFSDLMTSLFFIMLVLFVVVYSSQNTVISELNSAKKELSVRISDYERVQRLEAHMKRLRDNPAFVYIERCKKFVVKDLIGVEIFNPNESVIKSEFVEPALNAGRQLDMFLSKLNEDKDLSFIVVIEGNMANTFDYKIDANWDVGYKISYERALALYLLWQWNGIDLRKYNTEIIISGSGFNGICRESPQREAYNKRFTIQIYPKIGDLGHKSE
jgi:hypothetical protein